jgi:hypothetical protein
MHDSGWPEIGKFSRALSVCTPQYTEAGMFLEPRKSLS